MELYIDINKIDIDKKVAGVVERQISRVGIGWNAKMLVKRIVRLYVR